MNTSPINKCSNVSGCCNPCGFCTSHCCSVFRGPMGPQGPAGPQGPQGPAGPSSKLEGIQAQITTGENRVIGRNEIIVFDKIIVDSDPNISYDTASGKFTFLSPGNYIVNWWLNVNCSEMQDGSAMVSLEVNNIVHSSSVTPITVGQFLGQSLVIIDTAPSIAALVNTTQGAFDLSGIPPIQGGILIFS